MWHSSSASSLLFKIQNAFRKDDVSHPWRHGHRGFQTVYPFFLTVDHRMKITEEVKSKWQTENANRRHSGKKMERKAVGVKATRFCIWRPPFSYLTAWMCWLSGTCGAAWVWRYDKWKLCMTIVCVTNQWWSSLYFLLYSMPGIVLLAHLHIQRI